MRLARRFASVPAQLLPDGQIWDKYWFEPNGNVLTVVTQFYYLSQTAVQRINLTACLFWAMAIAGTGVAVCYWLRRKGNNSARNSS
jgi:hypothetical protein